MSHTNFCVASEQDKAEMLKAVKAKSFDDLFVDIPATFQTDAFNIPEGRSELEALQTLRGLAAKNANNITSNAPVGGNRLYRIRVEKQ
ncbi:MAG TPA: hypothetical protein DCZ95_18610 [Verrucomicrobia bacterium]|nr:MAG: hypothetical protein A2X46_14970 [Lentisphaerae bacterium GWF2_57_35]HBA86101.1 hypothetical protein [Verrucomicrobiota bacterium]